MEELPGKRVGDHDLHMDASTLEIYNIYNS